MKRLMPSGLITFLQANPNCLKADCFVIKLPTGTTMYVTEGQFDITIPSGTPGWTGATKTFLSTTYGRWERGSITSEASFGLSANSTTLTCIPQQGTAYPGTTTGILSAAFNGLLDASVVNVYTAYMPLNQAGNLLLWSQDLTQSTWVKTNSGASNPTVTIDGSVVAPDNTFTASAVAFPIVGAGNYSRIQQTLSVVPGGATVTFGIWLKASAAAPIKMEVISSTTPFAGSTPTVSVTTAWQFFTITQTWGTDPGTTIQVNFESTNTQPAVTVYAWGAQFIVGATLPTYQMTTSVAIQPSGYGNVNAGIETKFVGFIEKINKINRTMVEFEVQDPLFILNEKIPKRLIQSSCPWSFCDANCTLVAATYTQAFTAKSGSTSRILIPVSAFSQAVGYFTQGVVTCVTGANAGLSATVKLHDATGNINVVLPWIFPIVADDTFSVIAGCDKSATACKTRKTAVGGSVDNSLHFGGAIDVPVPDKAF